MDGPWVRRRILDPILGLLRQGITPERLALSLAFGLGVGIFPVLGVSTIACTVAAVAGQGWWAPATMLGLYLVLQTVESYVITPLIYGRAIRFDPLTVLIGVLFFGFLWGPLGFVAALPTLVLVRGFVEVIPGADPVTALIGEDGGHS